MTYTYDTKRMNQLCEIEEQISHKKAKRIGNSIWAGLGAVGSFYSGAKIIDHIEQGNYGWAIIWGVIMSANLDIIKDGYNGFVKRRKEIKMLNYQAENIRNGMLEKRVADAPQLEPARQHDTIDNVVNTEETVIKL